jgi:copper chaperone NosL
MKTNSLSKLSIILLSISGIGLVISIFVPIWAIYLEAPQYPEGLGMFLHANKITGDYEIINGLNHYIGMKTIHQEDFWEFKVLPYALGFFAVLAFLFAFLKKKWGLYLFTVLFLLFGVAFMIDFWLWEYDYGHNLNPNAPIIVPGMSYQPPLLGFKQLLNFGAYSYPDVGGWIMFAVGIISLVLSVLEFKSSKK